MGTPHCYLFSRLAKDFFKMNRVVMSVLGLGTLFVFMVGCNDGVANAPCNVSGKVTYKGAPVTGGNLTFWCKEGGSYSASLDASGKYTTANLPAGDAVVSVETETTNPNRKTENYSGGNNKVGQSDSGAPKKMTASPIPEYAKKSVITYVKIPAKYGKKDSPLTTTLKPGSNKADFDLVD